MRKRKSKPVVPVVPVGPQYDWASLAQVAWTYSKDTEGGDQALADWVELVSISNPDNKCSRTELIRRLKQDLEKNDDSGETLSQNRAADVFVQLSERAESYSNKGYPFRLDSDQDCVFFDSTKKQTLYVFLLALSYANPVPVIGEGVGSSGAQLFEKICVIALDRLFPPSPFYTDSAKTFHLGNPSVTGMPGLFWKKVDYFCAAIAEGTGNGYKTPPSGVAREAGDDGVDIIHRRGFPDRKGSQFLVSASCASGRTDWEKKRSECDPLAWTSQHMRAGVLAPPALSKCCFVPRMIPRDKWEGLSRRAGAVIDRCRLAHILNGVAASETDTAIRWLGVVIAGPGMPTTGVAA